MYNLTEAYRIIGPHHQHEMWNGRFASAFVDKERTMLTNELQQTVACYTFTLVLQGELCLETNGQQIIFHPGDLYIYLPGYPVRILSVTDDYQSLVLLVDEQTTYETPAFRNLTQASYSPLVQYGTPKLTIQPEDAQCLKSDMVSIYDHIQRPSLFSDDTLEMLYSVFILDLIDIQKHRLKPNHISRRTEDIFISFYALLRKHYVEHHDIGFYAGQLNMTTTYLSRVVKHVTGRTVMDHIDQMLVTEATWLLTSTSIPIYQIAERLHFATTASFDKFFTRMRGKSPNTYR